MTKKRNPLKTLSYIFDLNGQQCTSITLVSKNCKNIRNKQSFRKGEEVNGLFKELQKEWNK